MATSGAGVPQLSFWLWSYRVDGEAHLRYPAYMESEHSEQLTKVAAAVAYWLKYLGIAREWFVEVEITDDPEDYYYPDSNAETRWPDGYRMALLRFKSDVLNSGDAFLDHHAAHEVLHLYMADLHDMIHTELGDGNVSKKLLAEEEKLIDRIASLMLAQKPDG